MFYGKEILPKILKMFKSGLNLFESALTGSLFRQLLLFGHDFSLTCDDFFGRIK